MRRASLIAVAFIASLLGVAVGARKATEKILERIAGPAD
jgi:hypothetical protein